MSFRQSLPLGVKTWVDVSADLTTLIDDLRVPNGLDVWVQNAGPQHGVWRLDQQSALPLSPTVVATMSGIGRWIFFGSGSSSVPIGGTITWAPGIVSPVAPVYNDWFQIEAIVTALQGNVKLIIDQTNIIGFTQVPAGANLDGFGRLEIVGAGPRGEAELQVADGGQIKNVQSWRTIVVRAVPTIRPPVLYDEEGLIVECFDATFLFGALGVPTQPIIEINVLSYLGLYFIGSSELRNGAQPGVPVMNLGPTTDLLFAIGELFFPSSFDTTISGPATAQLNLQLDSSVTPVISLPAFLGARTTVQISLAEGTVYTPAVPANWVAPPPTNVQQALDRIASLVVALNAGVPIP